MQQIQRPPENTYILDIESAAETARLTNQHGLIARVMGGLCPEIIDFSGIKHVLNIACGPGIGLFSSQSWLPADSASVVFPRLLAGNR